jgi:hypothetical protein
MQDWSSNPPPATKTFRDLPASFPDSKSCEQSRVHGFQFGSCVVVPCFQNVEQLGTDRRKSPVLMRARQFDVRRRCVRVHVRRRAQVAVPEQLLNKLQVPSFLIDASRSRVAKGVEPRRLGTESSIDRSLDALAFRTNLNFLRPRIALLTQRCSQGW